MCQRVLEGVSVGVKYVEGLFEGMRRRRSSCMAGLQGTNVTELLNVIL